MAPRNKATAKAVRVTEVVIPEPALLSNWRGRRTVLPSPPTCCVSGKQSSLELKPVKSSTGQRMYRRKDVENVLRIKKLLYEEGFTIAGARQHLRAETEERQKTAGAAFSCSREYESEPDPSGPARNSHPAFSARLTDYPVLATHRKHGTRAAYNFRSDGPRQMRG